MSKLKVLELLKSNTALIEKLAFSDLLTTEGISETVGIQRNTTSQYLNELVKEQEAIKVKSRPALFFHKKVFTESFFDPDQEIYENLKQLEEEYRRKMYQSVDDKVFSSIIGADSSLKMAINQIKASVFYPGAGLPMMLHGETGVGKSLLARKTYEFCVQQQLIAENAPFIELNCAQYSHNPELLSSILFGYKKGAFTGADEHQIGLLEAADGGVLFLDECHRLSPEGQEKLFTFIDDQSFSRIGENHRVRKSTVRLIFATTEDLQKNFLRTFSRRVPITITVPSLQERTSQEILEYIYTFLIRESRNFDKNILITPWIMNRLMTLVYRDNVGELKNVIKIICANAYSKQPASQQVLISSEILENDLLARFLSLKEIDSMESQDVLITPKSEVIEFIQKENEETAIIKETFNEFIRVFQQFIKQEVTEEYVITQLSREATTVVELLVYEDNEEGETLKLFRETIKELVSFLESNFFIKVSGNSIVALSSYLYKRSGFSTEFLSFDSQMSTQIKEFMALNLLMEQKVLQALLTLVESKLDVVLNESEKIILTFYLRGLGLEVKKPEIHSVILAHGFSTASSIADVVNHFMEEHLFDSFDMPFNVNLDKVEDFMQHYIRVNDCSKGLVILADMGSLMILTERLKDQLTGPVLMINNVTTQLALYVAEMIKKDTDLEFIGERLVKNMKLEYKVTYPKIKKLPLVLTVCHTGLGAAQQLKEFIQSSLPEECGYKVEAVDFHYLKKYGDDNSLFKQYDVQGIVGTADPNIHGVSYVSFEDLISGQGQESIDRIFCGITDEKVRKEINNNLVRNLSIERLLSAITILDVARVISYIDEALDEIERRLKINLINSKKAILYVHIASLVERLIRNQEIMDYKGENTTDREKPLKIISEALEVVEKAYNITVSQYELNYLYDIIYDK